MNMLAVTISDLSTERFLYALQDFTVFMFL
jgi:hypothetical protein